MSNNIYCLRDWCCNWRLESDRTSVWRFCLCPTHSQQFNRNLYWIYNLWRLLYAVITPS